jgi:hypothetical protein
MAEPENIVLEHLRAIRTELADVKRQLESKAEAAQVADLGRKLDGLSHMFVSSLGSVVHSLDSLDKRVARLEREQV